MADGDVTPQDSVQLELHTQTTLRPHRSEDVLTDSHCFGLEELPEASEKRSRVARIFIEQKGTSPDSPSSDPYFADLWNPPLPPLTPVSRLILSPTVQGLRQDRVPGRNTPIGPQPPQSDGVETDKRKHSAGWWGITSGPVSVINEKSLALFRKVMDNATWRNLHWLPHQVLVYEVRVPEGYGMRWSQDQADREGDIVAKENRPWIFRGFLEPTMANGHELKWRHPINLS